MTKYEQNYEFQSDFMKRLAARGHAAGHAEGHAEGLLDGERAALLRVLAARGFGVSEELADKVRNCTDAAVLDRWLTRAVTVASLGDVFAD